MTNPFADITDPAILRALVQDGVECERCKGRRQLAKQVGMTNPFAKIECSTCDGTGHTPLSNANLDALAACWCEGYRHVPYVDGSCPALENSWIFPDGYQSEFPPTYTTSPDAAMRLMVKYCLSPIYVEGLGNYYLVRDLRGTEVCVPSESATVESLCHAITTAALIAAIKGASYG